MIGDKKYIEALILAGDKRSHNELASDLQLFRWSAKMAGKDWRYFQDKYRKDGKEESDKYNEIQGGQGEGSGLAKAASDDVCGMDS